MVVLLNFFTCICFQKLAKEKYFNAHISYKICCSEFKQKSDFTSLNFFSQLASIMISLAFTHSYTEEGVGGEEKLDCSLKTGAKLQGNSPFA